MARIKNYGHRSVNTPFGTSNDKFSKWHCYDVCPLCQAPKGTPCVRVRIRGAFTSTGSIYLAQRHNGRKKRAYSNEELQDIINSHPENRPNPNEQFFNSKHIEKPENCNCLWLDAIEFHRRHDTSRLACRYLAEDCTIHCVKNNR